MRVSNANAGKSENCAAACCRQMQNWPGDHVVEYSDYSQRAEVGQMSPTDDRKLRISFGPFVPMLPAFGADSVYRERLERRRRGQPQSTAKDLDQNLFHCCCD